MVQPFASDMSSPVVGYNRDVDEAIRGDYIDYTQTLCERARLRRLLESSLPDTGANIGFPAALASTHSKGAAGLGVAQLKFQWNRQ